MKQESGQALQAIIEQFVGGGARVKVQELGAGNINTTYLVVAGDRTFVLQRINRRVFPDPLAVVRNFQVVSRHLTEKSRETDSGYQFARLLPTLEGKAWYQDEMGEIWRAQSHLPGLALTGIGDDHQAEEMGEALGRFHVLLADLPPERLQPPLPGFHVLPDYLREYDRLGDDHRRNQNADIRRCLATVERYRPMAPILQLASEQGRLSTRIIHGDPKVDNFLFDRKQRRVISLIDLDTVGPGLLQYDLGDCLRSCCNRGGEGGDSSRVHFDMAICRALLTGYKRQMDGHLSRYDRQFLFEAVLLISFELGVRFLADHLRGDIYFRVRRAGENLQRALVQFALVERIAELEDDIRCQLA